MLTIVLALIAVLAVGAALILAIRSQQPEPLETRALSGEIDRLRQLSEQSSQAIAQLQGSQSGVQNSLNEVTRALGETNRVVAQQLQSSSGEVTRHLTDVQKTFAGLQHKVGEMTEQARQLGELSRSVADLQNILSAPKLRGGFGETQLENMLASVFAREQFEVQYRFPSGEIADAVLLFPQGKVAIDAKFPLENFRRIAMAASEADKKTARREFLKDVRKRIDEIAAKYIAPSAGTLPFALMYVPAENTYYEAVIRDEEGNDLYDYCVQRKVVPVSPNTLYAYLQTIVIGLNSLRISQRAESVLREINSLEGELMRFEDVYGKLGSHLRNAARSYEDSQRELAKVEGRVQVLTGNRTEQLPLITDMKKSAGAGE